MLLFFMVQLDMLGGAAPTVTVSPLVNGPLVKSLVDGGLVQ